MEGLFHTFQPLTIVTNFFEFFPFKLQPNGSLKFQYTSIAYIIILFLIFDVTIYLLINHMNEYRLAGSFLSKYSTIIVSVMLQMFIFIVVGMNVTSKTRIEGIFKKMWIVDVKLQKFIQPINYKKFRKVIILTLISTVTVYIITITIPWTIYTILSDAELEEFAVYTFMQVSWCGISIYSIFCCIIVSSIFIRMRLINEIVIQSLKVPQIASISKVHMLLCEISYTSLRPFSMQMAAMIGNTVLTLTFGLFEFYFGLKEHVDGLKLFYSILAVTTNFAFSSLVILSIVASSLTINEGEKTLKAVHDGIFREFKGNDMKTMKRYQMMLMQLQHFNANISCGLFRLDWKAVMMFFSTVYSYLLILIQSESLMKRQIGDQNDEFK